MKDPKAILITGASSGLGAELAKLYASDAKELHIAGRNEQRLEEVAKECELKGCKVYKKIIDVTDKQKMHDWIESILANGDLDLIFANAGVSAGTAAGIETESQTRTLFDINLNGTLNTILPALPYFENRQKGQIAIISSLSGFRGMPSCPAYSASKAAIKVLGEGIRGLLAKKNVMITVVTPGYIRSPMTKVNNFPMPFMVSAEKAAFIIKTKLQKNPARIAFPWPMYFIVWLTSCLSPSITDPIFSRLPGKAAIN